MAGSFGVSVVWHDIGKAIDTLTEYERRASIGTRNGIAACARLVEASAKRETPVDTGTLRRSEHVEGPEQVGMATWMAQIGPSELYGRRVELGFHGTDSLGRHFDQDGNPYMERGFYQVAGQFTGVMTASWAASMGL